ncbi:MAG: DMT family transporter [Gammaproteobacteria bacterium]|nr:DMT family transporter [Gammaproteobacteria bacterium]
MSNHLKGVLLAGLGILVISPDSLLIRFVNIDLWTLMFLRGLFIALALLIVNIIFYPSLSLIEQFRQLNRKEWTMVILMAVCSFAFVASIQTTSVAHTLIIVGTAPIFSAILGLYLLSEAVARNTWISIGIVFVGLIFVVYDQQQSTLLGDFYALITGLGWAVILVLARRSVKTNMFFIMMLSGLLIVIISLPIANLPDISVNQALLGSLLGTLNGIALSLLTFAPRFMPAAEVAVFLPLESVFGSLLVWWFLAEYPGHISLIAGLVIITTIMLNSYYQIKWSKAEY